jgi:uncharacterized protein (TIGR00299 family) protein
VRVERVQRAGVSARLVSVDTSEDASHRPATALVDSVERAPLAERVRGRALSALRRLIEVEASIHDEVADGLVVHELGGADTLVDVVGAFALVDALGIDEVTCSPVPFARGVIETRHGTIPGPGPAVVALLRGAQMEGVASDDELVTPTGAAIVAELASSFGELPAMRIDAVGYGAGSRDLAERPNVVRVVVGERVGAPATREVVLLETHVDDLLPELIPDVSEACRAAGALDVWTAAVSMKKGRPGVAISAVTRPDDEAAVARAMFEHGSTLGVRASRIRRYELDREMREVVVDGHAIRVKVGRLEGRVVNVAPEHDDCASVAAETHRPVKEVWALALAAASSALEERDDR